MHHASIIDQLKSLLGEENWILGNSEQALPYLQEWRGRYYGKTPIILFPNTTKHVSEIMKRCHQTKTPITIQAGNTGLVGGQIPQGEILLSLKKMNAIRSINSSNLCVIAEAGLVLSDLQNKLAEKNLFFPLTLASEGQAQIGGLVSTNAGGAHVIRFGMMRDLVLGLEIVLANGDILNGLHMLRKDNAGYDLKHVFIGSEGTLGLITAASLKLYPSPHERIVTWAGVESVSNLIAFLSSCQQQFSNTLYAFEMLPQFGLDLVLKHIPKTRSPLSSPSPWHVMIEFGFDKASSTHDEIEYFLANSLKQGLIQQASIAQNLNQQNAFFKLRESLSEAQKKEGASIKHDISIPTEYLDDFIKKACQMIQTMIPNARVLPFGHAGDGNLHFNILNPETMDTAIFLSYWEKMNQELHDLVDQFQGSIAAEHGIGILKKSELFRLKPKQDLNLMKKIKQLYDPENILNPRLIL